MQRFIIGVVFDLFVTSAYAVTSAHAQTKNFTIYVGDTYLIRSAISSTTSTVGYRLRINGQQVGSDLPVSAVQDGSITFDGPVQTATGTLTVNVGAYNTTGPVRYSPDTTVSVIQRPPTPAAPDIIVTTEQPPPPPPPPPSSNEFFSANWDTVALGCNNISVTDNLKFGSIDAIATYCVNPPKIEVVADGYSGNGIRKHQYPGDIGDGGGFETILSKAIPAIREWGGQWVVLYDPGYYWQADLKNWILGSATNPQDLYINNRPYYTCAGVGPDHHIGRLAIHNITNGTLWESSNVQFVPGQWYVVDWHVRASSTPTTADGVFEMKVNNTPVTWCNNPSTNIRTAENVYTRTKWSTYTNGSGDTAFQAAMPISYVFDSVKYCTGWCDPLTAPVAVPIVHETRQ